MWAIFSYMFRPQITALFTFKKLSMKYFGFKQGKMHVEIKK